MVKLALLYFTVLIGGVICNTRRPITGPPPNHSDSPIYPGSLPPPEFPSPIAEYPKPPHSFTGTTPTPRPPTSASPIVIGCENNGDCTTDNSCINKLCTDVCSGGNVCGQQAHCQTRNHRPLCLCPPGTIGNPWIQCSDILTERPKTVPPIAETVTPPHDIPIIPAAAPQEVRIPGLPTTPLLLPPPTPSPRPPPGPTPGPIVVGCQSNDECPIDNSCVNKLCRDACNPGVCGNNADCQTLEHRPICTCPPGTTGNPTIKCAALTFG